VTADDLLEIARELAVRETGRPKQTSLKRSVSTAYYALFHALAHECVGQTIGWTFRSPRYWETITTLYRAIDHAAAKRQFERYGRDPGASAELKQIGREFVALQAARIRADYDPSPVFTRIAVRQHIADAESAIRRLRELPIEAKRDLVVQILAKQR
jgi:hypothetical protein